MSIISPRVARWSLPRNCLASGSFVFIKRPSRSGASDFGTALNRFLRICLRSKIAFSSSALKLRFSCRTMAARIAAYRALSAEVGPCGSLMPGSISGGVMISPGVPPYPRCLLSRGIGRTAGRPLSRIALCGRKNRPKYPHGGGSGKADPGGRGLCGCGYGNAGVLWSACGGTTAAVGSGASVCEIAVNRTPIGCRDELCETFGSPDRVTPPIFGAMR